MLNNVFVNREIEILKLPMTIKFHKKLNCILYCFLLFWGEWVILHLFKGMIFAVFFISFIYSAILTINYKVNKFLIEY
jgi:hypothetical protein